MISIIFVSIENKRFKVKQNSVTNGLESTVSTNPAGLVFRFKK